MQSNLEKFTGLESAEQIIEKACEIFAPSIGIASSFSMEDIVLIDMLEKTKKPYKIFSLETGRLNPETLEIAQKISDKYQKKIDWYYPKQEEVEKLVSSKGLFSFRESVEERKHCCHIRKVEPLNRALKLLKAWITGQRRAQSVTRSKLALAEIDKAHNILKFNPLASWSSEQVKAYIDQYQLPYNKLHDLGYASIGCAPCTRAIKAGEDERAGRWWWENPEHKECGLHLG